MTWMRIPVCLCPRLPLELPACWCRKLQRAKGEKHSSASLPVLAGRQPTLATGMMPVD